MKSIFLSLFIVMFLFQAKTSADTTTGLVGWWKFDEGSGASAADGSGNTNTGTLTGSPTWTSSCRQGTCLNFNGSTAYVRVSNHASLQLSQFTVAFWINAVNAADTGAIEQPLNKGSPANYSFSWRHTNGSFVKSMAFYDNAWHPVQINGTMNTNTWYHVVSTYDGSSLKIYLQGSLDNTLSYSGTPIINGSDLTIGTQDGAGTYFNGSMDDVRIYNRALTGSDVAELYAQTSGVITRKLSNVSLSNFKTGP